MISTEKIKAAAKAHAYAGVMSGDLQAIFCSGVEEGFIAGAVWMGKVENPHYLGFKDVAGGHIWELEDDGLTFRSSTVNGLITIREMLYKVSRKEMNIFDPADV